MANQVAIEAGKGFIAGLPAAEKKAYEAVGKDPAALEILGNGVLMQADYTRKTQEAAEARKQADEALGKNKAKAEELKTWQEGATKKYTDTLEENEKLKTQVTEAVGRLSTIAARYSVPEEEIKLQMAATGQGADVAASAVASQGGVAVAAGEQGALKGAVRVEDFNLGLDNAIGLAADFHDIAADHQELFGSRLKIGELVKEATAAGARDLQQYWAEKYKVSDKRQELATKAQEERDNRIRQEEREKLSAEHGIPLTPGSKGNGRVSHRGGSPMLSQFRAQQAAREAQEKGGTEPAEIVDPVQAAVAHYNAQMTKD